MFPNFSKNNEVFVGQSDGERNWSDNESSVSPRGWTLGATKKPAVLDYNKWTWKKKPPYK